MVFLVAFDAAGGFDVMFSCDFMDRFVDVLLFVFFLDVSVIPVSFDEILDCSIRWRVLVDCVNIIKVFNFWLLGSTIEYQISFKLS